MTDACIYHVILGQMKKCDDDRPMQVQTRHKSTKSSSKLPSLKGIVNGEWLNDTHIIKAVCDLLKTQFPYTILN